MSLGLKRDKRFHQGYYRPKNAEKYIGKVQPIYRSGIELKFFKFCDDNPNITKWSSENIVIPYYDKVTNKWRKYYVDNFVEIREGNAIKKYLIELKDIKETKRPEAKRGKKKSTLLYEQATYETNMCKWSFANKFCKDHKMEFLLFGYSLNKGFEAVKLNL